MSVNKVILLGYVGSDPEIRYPEKTSRLRSCLWLQTNVMPILPRKSRNGILYDGRQEMPSLLRNTSAKGSRLYVEGKLRTREYDDRMKIRRRKTEIIVERFELLGRKNEPPA